MVAPHLDTQFSTMYQYRQKTPHSKKIIRHQYLTLRMSHFQRVRRLIINNQKV